MSDLPYHRTLRIQNITAFANASFEFAPGVNAIIGANGSGKTHLLKAMYAFQRRYTRDVEGVRAVLLRLFQIDNLSELLRVPSAPDSVREVSGEYGDHQWRYTLHKHSPGAYVDHSQPADANMAGAVFIPALDMMAHTRAFVEAYNEVFLDFDLTCRDIVTRFRLPNNVTYNAASLAVLSRLIPGGLYEDESGRFYVISSRGRRESMTVVAEGIRRIAALMQLYNNGWLTPGTTLYWDEPEANLNPTLMQSVVAAVLALARSGVQVFLTTHSYVILKELDLQTLPEDSVRYFSLVPTKKGTEVYSAAEFTALSHDAILDHYGSLYDRDLRRPLTAGDNA